MFIKNIPGTRIGKYRSPHCTAPTWGQETSQHMHTYHMAKTNIKAIQSPLSTQAWDGLGIASHTQGHVEREQELIAERDRWAFPSLLPGSLELGRRHCRGQRFSNGTESLITRLESLSNNEFISRGCEILTVFYLSLFHSTSSPPTPERQKQRVMNQKNYENSFKNSPLHVWTMLKCSAHSFYMQIFSK